MTGPDDTPAASPIFRRLLGYDDLRRHHFPGIEAPATLQQRKLIGNLTSAQFDATDLAGEPIVDKLTRAPGNDQPIGGIKVVAKSGWFAARPSGTEDVYKIYAESFRSEDHLKQIQDDAQTTIGRLFLPDRKWQRSDPKRRGV